jgi:hypothetical protein
MRFGQCIGLFHKIPSFQDLEGICLTIQRRVLGQRFSVGSQGDYIIYVCGLGKEGRKEGMKGIFINEGSQEGGKDRERVFQTFFFFNKFGVNLLLSQKKLSNGFAFPNELNKPKISYTLCNKMPCHTLSALTSLQQ